MIRIPPRIVWLALSCLLLAAPAGAAYRYPLAEIHVVSDTLHGEVIEDPYRWLEDREDPATSDWIARETAFSIARWRSRCSTSSSSRRTTTSSDSAARRGWSRACSTRTSSR